MKRIVLAVTVAAGLFGIVGKADAQRLRRGTVYSYPTYSSPYNSSYSTYSTPYSSYPTYSSGVVTSAYTPSYYDGGVITTSGYSYPYSSSSFYNSMPSSSFYNGSNFYNSGYNSYPYNTGYYNNPAYSPGLNVTPSGGYYNGMRLWRR